MSGGTTKTKERLDLESFTQAHLIAKDAIHAYVWLERGRVRNKRKRTVVMHPSEEGQPMELEHQSGAHRAQQRLTSTHLIILHLSTPNQLWLLLDLFKFDDGPPFRSEAFNLRFQIREEVTLCADQRREEMFVVVEPSMLSGCGLHLLRVYHYSKLILRAEERGGGINTIAT